MKLLTTFLGVLLASQSIFAQKSIDQAGVKISTAPLHCDVPAQGYVADLIALTITNTTNEVKTISYSFELHYDGNCATCGHDEYRYTQLLQPQETLQGICLDRNYLGLTIFDHMPAHLAATQLTDYQIRNVIVE